MEVLAVIRDEARDVDESWEEGRWNKEEVRKEGRGEDGRKEVGGISTFFYPHIPSFSDFKESPGEKELFPSAQAYRFVTPLLSSLVLCNPHPGHIS